MPKLQGYACRTCGEAFDYTHMNAEDLASCICGSTELDLQLGGKSFSTIIPTYPGAKRRKAGYQHLYVNRPAEKVSVSVPRTKEK